VDVFTPTPRNWKELVSPGDVFSPASRNKKKQEVRWTCCKNEKEITTKERSANVRRGFVAFFF